ncbi:hypothetical protein BD560DRAFT_405960 [Blakeslea trispora]|nr:hypothetical protein BD560DRAFT_405960 [Blakeslea trispora]
MLFTFVFLIVILASTSMARQTPLASLNIVVLGFQNPRIYTLTCDPTGGSHSAADGACDVLDDIRGNISSLPVVRSKRRGKPVLVSIKGFYHEKPVRFYKTYQSEAIAIQELDGLYPEQED